MATYGVEATPGPTYDWWSFGIDSTPAGFMVAEASGRVVGVQPMQIFRYADGARQLKGGMLTGVAVHPDFRRLGIFSALVRACEAEAWRQGALFVTTMPNDRSRRGFLKLGYTELGRRTLLMRSLRPSAMGGRVLPVIGHLAGAGLAAAQGILRSVKRSKGLIVREVSNLPVDVESLATRHTDLYPGVALQRTAEWWQWRYLQSPVHRYKFIEARQSSGALVGVAVTAAEIRRRIHMTYLMDLAVAERGVIPELLGATFAVERAAGAHAMTAVSSSRALACDLTRHGFWRIPFWAPLKRFYSVARFAPNVSIPSTWQNIEGWYQMLGDWDNL